MGLDCKPMDCLGLQFRPLDHVSICLHKFNPKSLLQIMLFSFSSKQLNLSLESNVNLEKNPYVNTEDHVITTPSIKVRMTWSSGHCIISRRRSGSMTDARENEFWSKYKQMTSMNVLHMGVFCGAFFVTWFERWIE